MDMAGGSSAGNKPDRRTVERYRRRLMKDLRSELVSLVPEQHFKPSKKVLSPLDQLEQVADYIKILTERVEERRKKLSLMMNARSTSYYNIGANIMGESKLPILEIKELGANVEVVLISGLNKKLMVDKIISIIEQEGAQVVTVGYSTNGDAIFRTLHGQVLIPRVGMDISRMRERIQELMG